MSFQGILTPLNWVTKYAQDKKSYDFWGNLEHSDLKWYSYRLENSHKLSPLNS